MLRGEIMRPQDMLFIVVYLSCVLFFMVSSNAFEIFLHSCPLLSPHHNLFSISSFTSKISMNFLPFLTSLHLFYQHDLLFS